MKKIKVSTLYELINLANLDDKLEPKVETPMTDNDPITDK